MMRPRRIGLALATATIVCLAATVRAQSQSELTVIAPAGGETWEIGSRRLVEWAGPAGGNVRIELSRDGGGSYEVLVSNTPNDGAEEAAVAGPASTECRVRVTYLNDARIRGVSFADFAIVEPLPTFGVTGPNGGEVWVVGTQQLITWSGTGPGDVSIELSRDGGVFFDVLFDRTRNDGSELWTVTQPVSGIAVIRIVRLDEPTAQDESDAPFIITASVHSPVLAPNGGEVWTVGSRQLIRWQQLGAGRVAIEVSRDGGLLWEVLFDNTLDDGIQAWVVEGPASTAALVRVRRLSTPPVSDVSDQPFTITTAPITLITPQGGENWVEGTQRAIRWASIGGGSVAIDLSRDGGRTWEILLQSTPNDGSQFWTVAGPPTANALVRIVSIEDPLVLDTSEAPFTIAAGTLELVSPNGGEQWPLGLAQPLQWATTTGGSVRIDLSRDGGRSWEPLFENTPNDGYEAWKATGPASPTCRVRIISWHDQDLLDASDADFALYCSPVSAPIDAGQTRTGVLLPTDCESVHHPGGRARLHRFSMPAAGLVSLTVRSSAFDPYVVLLGPDDRVIAENDNTGTGTDAGLGSIELAAGGPYYIEVTSARPGGTGDYSVTLERYDIELLGPTGGETWKLGEQHTISWRSSAPSAAVDVTLFRTGDPRASAELVASGTANDGGHAWTVTGPPTATAVFQVCIPYGSRGTKVCDTGAAVALEACAVDSTRSCYTGPEGTLGVGACRPGLQTCGADGVFGACTGHTGPVTEVCGDGVDQDCNGVDVPCPVCGGTNCADDDPCTEDACVTGKCQNKLPTGFSLLDCRRATLDETLAGVEVACRSDGLTTVRRRHLRRIERLFADIERLVARARVARGRGRCVGHFAAARRRAMKLQQRVETFASRGIVCGASAPVLTHRVQALTMTIIQLSSCASTP